VGAPALVDTTTLPARGGDVAPAAAPPVPVRTLAHATIGAVGDVMIQDAVKRSVAAHGVGAPDEGYSWLFAPVSDLLAEPDLTFANLETPVAPDASKGTREFMFNAPPAAVAALKRAGVDLVSVANNHMFDQGRPGFEETLRRLDALGMRYVGAGPAGNAAGPVRVEVNGLALAFLGYAYQFNQDGNLCPTPPRGPCLQASELDRSRVVEDVRAAAASGADAVVVSLHFGHEYEGQPRREDIALAHALADAGALLVIGTHPHVLQPVEIYRRADGQPAIVAYSLGNFVSNQSRKYVSGVTPESVAAPREGALLRVTIARRDYGRGVTRVEVTGADVLPLWTENDTAEIDPVREPGRRPAIRVVAVDRALAEVRGELGRLPDPVPPAEQARYVRLRQREALLVARRASIGATVGEELLRSLAPAELAPAAAVAATPSGAR
jgi:Bacterial capsule synthesis protein PGA_cap